LNDIHDLLKTKTALLHSQLESLPFFEALQRHNLPKVSIVSFLRCLAIIHAVLERKLSRISQHQVSLLHDATLPKLPLLTADLEVLDETILPSAFQYIQGTDQGQWVSFPEDFIGIIDCASYRRGNAVPHM